MQIYIKSAGFSVNQDYSWIDQSGKNVDIDLSILSYNVEGVKFVWKSTAETIYIFGNAFIDKSRTDLYNRPLRNYLLLEGQIDEAISMFECFEKMLLDQKNFEDLLNSNIRNEGGDSKAGFSADFQKISSYFDSHLSGVREEYKLKRHLYENDSYEAREGLLNELWSVRTKPVTLLVGGELSAGRMQAIAPDRALLNNFNDAEYRKYQGSASGDLPKSVKKAVAVGIAVFAGTLITSVLVLALFGNKD